MRAVRLTPLGPYPGANVPWRCRCDICGRESSPRHASAKHRGSGCNYCGYRVAGETYRQRHFASHKTLLYLLGRDDGLLKIGITHETGRRLNQHRRHGWEALRVWEYADRIEAEKMERQVIGWWRINGWKQGIDWLPQDGATETVGAADISAERTGGYVDAILACRLSRNAGSEYE